MLDLLTVLAFLMMVISPCLVAMRTGVADGSDLGVKDLSEQNPDAGQAYIP